MSFTGNSYCKFCGDLIDPEKEPYEDVCGRCFTTKLEDGTSRVDYKSFIQRKVKKK